MKMLFLLPLIMLVAANPCPYCKWGSCTFTAGGLPDCSECYDLAALIPAKIPATATTAQVPDLGVCQLCCDHCNKCEYGMKMTANGQEPGIICSSCSFGYTLNQATGNCDQS